MQAQITIAESIAEAERQLIIGGLVGYNNVAASQEQYRGLIALARDGSELVGGLLGYTHWNWLFISHLWLAQNARGSGTGSRLLRAAEDEAAARGCAHAHCDTFSFQALPFYEKHGYEVFGQLDDYPPGHCRYFLRKRNLALYSEGNARFATCSQPAPRP